VVHNICNLTKRTTLSSICSKTSASFFFKRGGSKRKPPKMLNSAINQCNTQILKRENNRTYSENR